MTEQITMIPARLKNAAVNGHVAGAADIIDDAKAKTQDVINQDVDTAIGDDDVEGSIKGRIKALEEAVGPGGSVEEQIDAKVATLDASVSQTAGADGLALSVTEADGIVTSVSGSIAANTYDAHGAAATAKTELLGDAATNYNTLGKLEDAIQAEATARGNEDTALDGRLDTVEGLIPSQAATTNQLADKAFVNSSISTATANFKGTKNLVTDLNLTISATESQVATALATAITGADNNDYCFVQIPTADATPTEIARVDRYKYNGTAWSFEYSLNNSSYTAAQWAAINSGITSILVTAFNAKYDLPATGMPSTDMSSAVQTSLGKADSAYQKPSGGIPGTDLTTGVQTSLGKADTAYQLPSGGMPSADMASAVQTSLGLADSAYQKPSTGIPSIDLASAAQTSLGKADTAVQPADLATVATSGSYNDLVDKPSIPSGQVQSDWNQTVTSEVDYIKNKPTNVSAFTNDAGYLTQHQSLDNYYTKTQTDGLLGDKQDTLVSGTNIKTINSQSLLGSGNIDIQTGGTYTEGNGIDITNDEISVKAGSNLSFDANGNLNATDTTYSVMGGSGASHASGLVPDPGATAGTTKYLREDGTWQEVNALPEVEIGETAPTGTPKLFVDEDADPAVAINIYNKTQVDTLLSAKADEATTLNGYGITDAYTKTQIDALTRHTRLTDFDLNVLKQAVADQNLEKYGLKVGDEKTVNGHTYVIAGLNPMKGTSTPYRLTQNHVGLIVIPHTTQAWNASGNTSTGADGRGAGYMNSDLHYYLKNTLLPLVETDLGAANLLGHNKLLSKAVTDGKSSDWGWEEGCKLCALSEVQVYGATVWSSSGFDTGEACRQLDVFRHYNHSEIFGSEYPWLRDVVSASRAAYASDSGDANYDPASNAGYVAALILFH